MTKGHWHKWGPQDAAADPSYPTYPYQLNFDGFEQSLTATGTSVLNVGAGQPFTVIATFKAYSTGGGAVGTIVAKDDRVAIKQLFNIHLEAGALVGYVWGSAGARFTGRSSSAITLNTWYRVALVYTGGANRPALYLDTVSQATTYDNAGTFLGTDDSTGGLYIGGVNFQNRSFYGAIRDVWMWNSALSATEIAEVQSTYTPLPRTNHGAYVSAANLINGYALQSQTPNLVSSGGVLDAIGSGHLTGNNFDNVKFASASSHKLSAGTGVVTAGTAQSYAWDFYATASGGAMLAMDCRSGTVAETFQFQTSGVNDLYAYFWDQTANAYIGKSGTFSLSAWHHAVVTFDGSTTVKFYVDGTELTTNFNGGAFATINNFAAEFLFGAAKVSGAYDRFLDGRMRWAAKWNSALSATEVTAINSNYFDYQTNSGNYVSAANLAHQWKLQGGYNDLTTAGGLPAAVGGKTLTGSNFTKSTIEDYAGPS